MFDSNSDLDDHNITNNNVDDILTYDRLYDFLTYTVPIEGM